MERGRKPRGREKGREEDEKRFTRFITKRCFASVFNGPPARWKVSAKVVTARLSIFFSPLSPCVFLFSFALSSPSSGSNAGTVSALFSIFFYPSPVAHSLRWKEVPAQRDREDVSSFHTIRHTSSVSDIPFLRSCVSVKGVNSRQSDRGIYDYMLLRNIECCYVTDSLRFGRIVLEIDPCVENIFHLRRTNQIVIKLFCLGEFDMIQLLSVCIVLNKETRGAILDD